MKVHLTLLIWTAVTGLFASGFVTAYLDQGRAKWAAAIAVAALFLAGTTLAQAIAIDDSPYLAAATAGIVAAGCAAIPLIVQRSQRTAWDAIGVAGFVSWVSGTLILAAVAGYADSNKTDVLVMVSGAEFFFDILVYSLFRERFRRLVDDEVEQNELKRPPVRQREYRILAEGGSLERLERRQKRRERKIEDRGFVPGYPILFLAAGTALIALAVLLGFAATPLGLAADSGASEVSVASGLTLGAVAVISVLIVAAARTRIQPAGVKASSAPALNLDGISTALLVAAALGLGVAALLLPWLFEQQRHFELLAALPALAYGFFTAESLGASSARLELQEPGWRGWLVAGAGGLAAASAAWWLFSVGLWSGSGPANVGALSGLVVLTLVSSAGLSIALGQALVKAGTGEQFTPGEPGDNVWLDHGLYAFFSILIGVVPLAIIAHIEVNSGAATGLVTSLAFIPGMIGGFLWVVDNNRTHHAHQQSLPRPTTPMWARADAIAGDPTVSESVHRLAHSLLHRYRRAMRVHATTQNLGSELVLFAMTAAVIVRLLLD